LTGSLSLPSKAACSLAHQFSTRQANPPAIVHLHHVSLVDRSCILNSFKERNPEGLCLGTGNGNGISQHRSRRVLVSPLQPEYRRLRLLLHPRHHKLRFYWALRGIRSNVVILFGGLYEATVKIRRERTRVGKLGPRHRRALQHSRFRSRCAGRYPIRSASPLPEVSISH
jgi:hypothetical protein